MKPRPVHITMAYLVMIGFFCCCLLPAVYGQTVIPSMYKPDKPGIMNFSLVDPVNISYPTSTSTTSSALLPESDSPPKTTGHFSNCKFSRADFNHLKHPTK